MRFFKDLKKYFGYARFAAKSALNAEVAGSYLNWLWWVFNPLCMMIIYTIIFDKIFDGGMEYAPVFIFIGLTVWDFFNRNLNDSIRIVKNNKSTVTKVYLPKFVLIETNMFVNFIKMLISFAIVVIMLIVLQVPTGFNAFWILPSLVVLFLFTFGMGTICMHFGVFVEDLKNIVKILLRFVFYATGIFYSIEDRIGNPVISRLMLKCNPMAFLIDSIRKSLIYNERPDFLLLLVWFVISLVLCVIGIQVVYKYENSYAKII